MSARNLHARLLGAGAFVSALALASPAPAQSFDCAKARPPIETAICAAPDLRALDNALAGAYARALFALKDDSAALDALKQAQRAFLGARDRECAEPSGVVACLARAYRARLDALAAYRAPQTPAPQQAAAQPQPAPRQAAPVEIAPPAVPANADSGALVKIPAPDRYMIRAESRTGVALQLVDMIAGPGDTSGAAGQRDGRLDLLLDAGVYKARTFGVKAAAGEAKLVAQAYREIAGGALGVAPVQGELRDLEQSSWRLDVGAEGTVAIEALGRNLGDLRLWRDGEALVDLAPEIGAVETRKGRLMTRARLQGAVEPGRYVATAYGGPPHVWTEGGDAAPFLLRRLDPANLASGLFEGALGAFGSAHFTAPADVDYVRLETPEPAPVRLVLRRKGQPPVEAALAANSRDPFVVAIPRGSAGLIEVEVAGLEGQQFRLRALHRAPSARLSGEGPSLVFVDVAGEGGDEIPATAVLARLERGRATALAADAPKVGPGAAWRRRFNLRGPSSIIFEATGAGPVAVAVKGRVARATIEPAFGGAPLASRAEARAVYDLQPGFYTLRLSPPDNGAGVVDVALGSPGLTPDLSPAPAARTAIFLGRVSLERGVSYEARVNEAPGLAVGVRAVTTPVDLGKAPLALWQGIAPKTLVRETQPEKHGARETPAPTKAAISQTPLPPQRAAAKPQTPPPPTREAGQPAKPAPKPAPARPERPPVAPAQFAQPAVEDTTFRARAPLGGRIVARDQHGGEIAVEIADEKIEKGERTFLLRLPRATAPRALAVFWRPDPQSVRPTTPAALATLAPDAPHWFDLARDQKREFRIEAKEGGLYRVETLGRLATGVAIGSNFLPRLAEGRDNGRGRNGMAQAYLRAGAYRVAVQALSESSGRAGISLAPAPLLSTGALTDGASVRASLAGGRGAVVPIEIAKEGDYRLELYALGRDLHARLEDAEGWPLTAPGRVRRIETKLAPGKYRLVVAPEDVDARMVARLTARPREIAREGHGPHPLPFDAEQKNQWREPVATGAARAPDVWTFALAGEADAELTISEGMIGELIRGEKEIVGKFVATRPWRGKLGPGGFRVEARALARDDRLDYTIALSADQLQPGAPRIVDLPARVPFALAEPRVVNLTSFGRTDLTGVLKDAQGRVVERLAGRADDWNIALSRVLPAGAYKLELYETSERALLDDGRPETAADESETEEGEDESANDDAQTGVELRLALPAEAAPQTLGATGAARFSGARAHRFALPKASPGALALVAAQSAAELTLALERRGADGVWRVAAYDRGRAPVAAMPADGGEWRAAVWAVDGVDETVSVAARVIEAAPKSGADIALDPFPIPELGLTLAVARMRAPGALALELDPGAHEILAGSSDGRPLQSARAGLFAPQSENLWLVAREAVAVHVAPARETGEPFAFALGAGESAKLPAGGAPQGAARVWIARSGAGQPMLGADAAGAVAEGAAVALAGKAPLVLSNAGEEETLRVDLDRRDLKLEGETRAESGFAGVLAPRSAQPVALPAGEKRLTLDLGGGVAALSSGAGKSRVAIFADGGALTRMANADATALMLINLTDHPAPVRLSVAPGRIETLAAGRVEKRLHGAAGSFVLPVAANAGDVLRVEGGQTTFVAASGAVRRGGEIALDGPGELAVDHGPGLVAAWLERAGESPWPKTQPQPVAPPAQFTLQGAAQSFALDVKAPGLIDLSTGAPAVVVLEQNGRRETALYAAGVDFHRFVAAGPARVTLYAAHDGALSGAGSLGFTQPSEIGEGVGAPVALAPGASALFAFDVTAEREVGVGLRADPDRAAARLLDANGAVVGEGVSMMRKLKPGRHWLEARAPSDAALVVRPALVGLSPPPASPPVEEIEALLEKAGMKARK